MPGSTGSVVAWSAWPAPAQSSSATLGRNQTRCAVSARASRTCVAGCTRLMAKADSISASIAPSKSGEEHREMHGWPGPSDCHGHGRLLGLVTTASLTCSTRGIAGAGIGDDIACCRSLNGSSVIAICSPLSNCLFVARARPCVAPAPSRRDPVGSSARAWQKNWCGRFAERENDGAEEAGTRRGGQRSVRSGPCCGGQ